MSSVHRRLFVVLLHFSFLHTRHVLQCFAEHGGRAQPLHKVLRFLSCRLCHMPELYALSGCLRPQTSHLCPPHPEHMYWWTSSTVFGNCFGLNVLTSFVHGSFLQSTFLQTLHVLQSMDVQGGLQQILHKVLCVLSSRCFHIPGVYSVHGLVSLQRSHSLDSCVASPLHSKHFLFTPGAMMRVQYSSYQSSPVAFFGK